MASQNNADREAVKKRLRFDGNDDVREFNSQESPQSFSQGLLNGRHHKQEEESLSFSIAFIIFMVMLVGVLLSFVPLNIWTALGFILVEKEGDLYINWKENKHIYITGLLLCIGKSLLLALGCLGLSWNIIYYDSLVPGQNPPSPASPAKYRKKSGHTFHIGYSMCLVNSAAVFIYAVYWMRGQYL